MSGLCVTCVVGEWVLVCVDVCGGGGVVSDWLLMLRVILY